MGAESGPKPKAQNNCSLVIQCMHATQSRKSCLSLRVTICVTTRVDTNSQKIKWVQDDEVKRLYQHAIRHACFSVSVFKTLSKVLLRGKDIMTLLRKKHKMLHGLCDATAGYEQERRTMKSYYLWLEGRMCNWRFYCCLDRSSCDK